MGFEKSVPEKYPAAACVAVFALQNETRRRSNTCLSSEAFKAKGGNLLIPNFHKIS
jgi:hypothetical protein